MEEGVGLILVCFFSFIFSVQADSESVCRDLDAMMALRNSLIIPSGFGWSDPDPCRWSWVSCTSDKWVYRIQVGRKNLKGSLPPNLARLRALEVFEVQYNEIGGPLPSLSGMSSLKRILLTNNNFTSIPSDFFAGMSSLENANVDFNPFSQWEIPASLKDAVLLQYFSANAANVSGKIPHFFGHAFPSLVDLHLAYNSLEGGLPSTFSGSSIQSLWLSGQKKTITVNGTTQVLPSDLTGTIEVFQNMTSLRQIWINFNRFSGPLPDLSNLKILEDLNLRDNGFTGPVPSTILGLPSLKVVNLTNNMLQGPTPKFPPSVAVDMIQGTNHFCFPDPSPCSPNVNTLLEVAKSVGYPSNFAESWMGNDPCHQWLGITCAAGNITVVNFQKMGLSGTISSSFSKLTSVQSLVLANNNLTGTIPVDLTSLPNLKNLDVSNNQLHGPVPTFRRDVTVNTRGNPGIGK